MLQLRENRTLAENIEYTIDDVEQLKQWDWDLVKSRQLTAYSDAIKAMTARRYIAPTAGTIYSACRPAILFSRLNPDSRSLSNN